MFESIKKLFKPKKKAKEKVSFREARAIEVFNSTKNNFSVDSYSDPLSPLNPMSITSPLNPLNYQEPSHKSDCGSSHHSTHSFDHSHSSSYDSGSCSSSYDSGSSSSSSDF